MERGFKYRMRSLVCRGIILMLLILGGMIGMKIQTFAAESGAGTWELKIVNENKMENRVVGEQFSPKGIISSNHNLQNIFIVVYDAQGKEMVSCLRTNLNVKQYDICKMSLDVTKLPAGKNYTYIVAARDQAGKKNLVKVNFDVMEPSRMAIQNYGYLGTLTKGNGFKIAGTLTSNYEILTCYAAIYDSGERVVTDLVKEPKGKSFDLVNMTLVGAQNLPAGTYTYRLAARDELGRKVLIKEELKIVEPIDPYTQKVKEFTEHEIWKHGAAWSANKGPVISSYSGSGCCAYAADFAKYVFGSDNVRGGAEFTGPDEIRAGDVLWVSGTSHWIVVLQRNGAQLTTAEGNWAGKVVISSTAYTVNQNRLMRDGKKFRTFEKGYHFR